MAKAPMFKVNDKVAYSVDFLRSIGETTGEMPFARGIVVKVSEFTTNRQLVTVDWDNEDIPAKVLNCNLAIVGPNIRFCAC